MRALALIAVLMLSACAVSGALYKDKNRSVMPMSFKGGETFCWEGVGWNNVGVGAIGWGTHECSRGNAMIRER